MKIFQIPFFIFLFMSVAVFGQTSKDKYYSKVVEKDSIISTLYKVISGDKTQPRNWELFRYLFNEDARLISTRKTSDDKQDAYFMSVNQYIENATAFFKQHNFYEKELYRITERFGPLVHIFSTYETLNKLDAKTPTARGINSIQLLYDGQRWWIINIYWNSETRDNKIPEHYLPTSN